MSRSTPELLGEALVHLELACEYAGGEDLDQLVIDAICMRLSAGIEVLARLDPDVRARLFGDDWQFMWGERRKLFLLGKRGRPRATQKWAPPVLEDACDP